MEDYAHGDVGWGGWMCVVFIFFHSYPHNCTFTWSCVRTSNKILNYKLSFFPLFFFSLHDITVCTL